ncbi:cephalosporin-C deacetylase [Psychrobacillus sp. OK028]|uniref:acetylxylan esterase n=1 Tax=Psychrobacillus sp. OK028 TaxID=1884359 RepID=UPI0008848E25|nr:acetylxylan esterase [Psychrobacillus sp. OK028]SDN57099.1 cephalosporin-C deacetylase [Psychrobacillus sp. OK028]
MGRQVGDLPIEELREYKPSLTNKPTDFKLFWEKQKNDLISILPFVDVGWRNYPVPTVEVADITFKSWDSTPLTGFLIKPKSVDNCPVIINFHGYTGSCGLPIDYLKWTSLGVAVYSFDVRGQGNSPDFAKYLNGSRTPGWMLKGIQDPTNYYYTNVYRDLLMIERWIRSEDAPVAVTKLGLTGSSQGGGLALSLAALIGKVDLVIADYPFIAHFERALEVANLGPYMEIVNYFKLTDPQYKTYDKVMRTLGYIDSVHFCDEITCPALMTIGLEDAVTPPSTVFAAYNHLSSTEKRIEVYPQFTHENNPFHEENKLSFIMKHLVNAI